MLTADAILISKSLSVEDVRKAFSTNNKQYIPYISQYENMEYSIYDKAIFAAKELILRKCNRDIEETNLEFDKVSNNNETSDSVIESLKETIGQKQYFKNILFGPVACYNDALYFLAKSIVKAFCIAEAVIGEASASFEEKHKDFIKNFNIVYIRCEKDNKNVIEFCVSFNVESKNPIQKDDEACCSDDFIAAKPVIVSGAVAIADIYEVNRFDFKSNRKIACRGKDEFFVCLSNEVNKQISSESQSDIYNDFKGKFIDFKNVIYSIAIREKATNGSHCLSCDKFPFKERQCNPLYSEAVSPEEQKKVLEEEYNLTEYPDGFNVKIDSDKSQYFVSSKFSFIERALEDLELHFGREDLAQVKTSPEIVDNEDDSEDVETEEEK